MADQTLSQLQLTLRRNRLSLTRPRRTVFYALQREPQTMSELIAHCAAVDRASVYRCARLYEQLGILQRLQIGWKYKLELTGSFRPHHHHLSCNRCGSVTVLAEDTVLEARLRKLSRQHGFTPQEHQLEIGGVCANCRSTTSPSFTPNNQSA